MKYHHFLVGLLLLWVGAFFVPRLPIWVGLIVYIAIALAIARSAIIKYHSVGWISGALLAVLLLTLPLWLWAMYAAYERWQR